MLLLVIAVLTCQTASALSVLDLLPSGSASEEVHLKISKPKSQVDTLPYKSVKSSYVDYQLHNPFRNLPERDLKSFLSHIEPVRDQKQQFRYVTQIIENTCNQYKNYLQDAESRELSTDLDVRTFQLITRMCVGYLDTYLALREGSLEDDEGYGEDLDSPVPTSDDETANKPTESPKCKCQDVSWTESPEALP